MKALRLSGRALRFTAVLAIAFAAIDFVLPPKWFGWADSAAAQSSQGCQLTSTAPCANSYSANGIQSFVRTYKYSSLGNTPAATPTDLFTITGSATKTVRVTKIVISGLATAAGQLNPLIIRRSSADSGGTSTAPALLPRDSVNSTTSGTAATATLALYTANPASLGTTVGTLDSCRLFLQVAAGGSPDVCVFSYGTNDDQLTVLRGTTDILAINFAGAAVPTNGVIDIDVELTEEP
jgi:hypothetical protein